MPFQRILLPTDFSEQAAAAATCANELAEQIGAELHLLHILESHVTTMPQFGMGVVLPSRAPESRAAAEKLLAGLLGPHPSEGGTIIRAVAEEPVASGIVRYALQHKIDLIVMSTHGRSGLAQILMGSVAEAALRTAPCPVLMVRPTVKMDAAS